METILNKKKWDGSACQGIVLSGLCKGGIVFYRKVANLLGKGFARTDGPSIKGTYLGDGWRNFTSTAAGDYVDFFIGKAKNVYKTDSDYTIVIETRNLKGNGRLNLSQFISYRRHKSIYGGRTAYSRKQYVQEGKSKNTPKLYRCNVRVKDVC